MKADLSVFVNIGVHNRISFICSRRRSRTASRGHPVGKCFLFAFRLQDRQAGLCGDVNNLVGRQVLLPYPQILNVGRSDASVLDLDGFCRALALALHAADAADVADLARDGALVLIAAADEHSLLIRHLLDDFLRAGISAGHAADALVAVDLGNAVDDVHRAELAGSGAVAEADAGEAALLVALAAEQHGSLAILGPFVVEALD